MNSRKSWQGALTIARLNWPFYAGAAVVFIISLWGSLRFSEPVWRLGFTAGLAGCVWFLLGSLGVSHLIYDRSDLYRWNWLKRALRGADSSEAMVFCHSGFDEASEAMRAELGLARRWTILDHFDATRMTEPSIRRARRLYPPAEGTLAAKFDQWPVGTESVEVIFGFLAIHELRGETERAAWFAEAKRCLRPGGRVVIVEHLRDAANFLAFGPGFLHFHSRAGWRRSWERAGLRTADEFRVTPWIRMFVLTAA